MKFSVFFTLTSLLSGGGSAVAFLWGSQTRSASPLDGLQEQLFGSDGPMFVYQTSDTRFSTDAEKDASKFVPQVPAQAPSKNVPYNPAQFVNNFQGQPPKTLTYQTPPFVPSFQRPPRPQPGADYLSKPQTNVKFLRQPVQQSKIVEMPKPAPVMNSNRDSQMKPTPAGVMSPDAVSPSKPVIYGPLRTSIDGACPNNFLCCNNDAVYENKFKILKCCGAASFDPRYERCSNQNVTPIREGMPELTPANRLHHVRCGPALEVYLTPMSYDCCNGTFYDSAKFQCSDEPATSSFSNFPSFSVSQQVDLNPTTTETPRHLAQPERTLQPAKPQPEEIRVAPQILRKSMPHVSAPKHDDPSQGYEYMVCEIYRYNIKFHDLRTWGCCGSQIFNYRKENCTDGEINPNGNHKSPVQRPRAQLMIYCMGGVRHWIDPVELTTTRCCGSQLCRREIVREMMYNREEQRKSQRQLDK